MKKQSDHSVSTNKLSATQQQDNPAKTLATYAAILNAEPGNMEILSLSGTLALSLKDFETAATRLARLVTLDDANYHAWTQLASALVMLGKAEHALPCVEKALSLAPMFVAAHLTQGAIYQAMHQFENALASYEHVLTIDSNNVDALNNCGVVHLALNAVDNAIFRLNTAREIDPNNVAVLVNLGNALRDAKRFNDATLMYQKALLIDNACHGARFNLAMLRLSEGDFKAGWQDYESRWDVPGFPTAKRDFPVPLWTGKENLLSKAIFIHSEQGLGDTVQFCRYLCLLEEKGAAIFMEVEPVLISLLQKAFPKVVFIEKGSLENGVAFPAVSFHCPLMSLPLAFSTEISTIFSPPAYLFSPPDLQQLWATQLGPKTRPRIGFAWAGNPKHSNDRNRSMPFPLFKSTLLDMTPGIDWVSLAKEVAPAIVNSMNTLTQVRNMGLRSRNFDDTAALIMEMDLVITVDTAVAHLAGALGKTVWLMVAHASEWRWLQDINTSPWYASVQIIRQSAHGDWESVLQQVYALLEKHFEKEVITKNFQVISDVTRWRNVALLESAWDTRAEIVAQYIPNGATVLDIGCGKGALEMFLPKGCRYQPCDIVERDARTIVVDLNKGEFPHQAAAQADIITFLGVIEYVVDVQSLFYTLRSLNKPIVMTYHPTQMTTGMDRVSLGWLNHLSIEDIAQLFVANGFQVTNMERVGDIQVLFSLTPKNEQSIQQALPTPKRVAVLSYANVGNFGDRLGYHLLNSVLPSNAVVEHFYFKPWNLPDLSNFDLLVLGIGNSLFSPMMTKELELALEQVPHAIGIFGTQYREQIDQSQMKRIISKLDRWYARHEEDILLFGKDANNVMHLGDWLIDAFPMTPAFNETPFFVGDEVWQDSPLDRTIQRIQEHTTVSSTRLHPLLCALTSANIVQYTEQRESFNGEISGKFRSMFMDIFGRNYPENTPWEVDKKKVLAYKKYVADNMQILRDDLEYLLNSTIG